MAFFSAARPSTSRPRRRREEGYVMLYLLLMVALMGIVALAVMVPIKFDLKREQEQEMIHRGVQYSRAIRNYYKKFGRYPTRLEDLDNTNNLRYLRKHYKDPVTGKDFKLLHYGDPGLSMGGSVGSTPIAGANTVGQMNGSSGSAFGGPGGGSGFGQSSGFGGSSNSGFGGSSSSAFGGSSNSGFGSSSSSGFGSSNSSGTSNTGASSGSSTTPPAGADSSQSGTGTAQDSSSTQSGSSGQGNNQVFGGGPIVGVASLSKDKTIREFNHKYKYNEWQFIYDPTTDRGGLILTPYQPALQLASQPLNGQPGNSNTSGSSFGQPTGFGNSNPGLMGGPQTPQQPPSTSTSPQPQ
jgi:type II secretory pathway pseudopilin PulG